MRFPRKAVVITTVAAALAAGASVAYGTIPDRGGVIHGCYQTNKGTLRVIDPSTDSCSTGETALDWNQTGPQGPQGLQGPQGP